MTDLTSFVDRLSSLTVIEAAQLSKLLEKQWGVSAAVPVAVTQTNVPLPQVEEKTEFDVTLLPGYPADKKIAIIKEVRQITGLGLKEAKDLVENAPKILKESAHKADADKIKNQITAAGGSVEVN